MSPPCRRSALWLFARCLFALGPCACGTKDAPPQRQSFEARTEWPSPMVDAFAECSDVGDLRVCWGPGGAMAVTARAVPAVEISALGFRCRGNGAHRVCVDRALEAEAFHCDGDRCEERHPRLPDSGEWECADIAGAVFCRGGEPAASVPPGASDGAFQCAERTVHGTPTPERLCVDWSPDFPAGQQHGYGYRCRFEDDHGTVRVCEKDASVHRVGDACDRAHPCIGGLVCASSRCVPSQPKPGCWLDRDCDQAVCRFGACTPRSP